MYVVLATLSDNLLAASQSYTLFNSTFMESGVDYEFLVFWEFIKLSIIAIYSMELNFEVFVNDMKQKTTLCNIQVHTR